MPCSMPTSVWLSGFFNPQSFLTAIMQSTARKNELPLDKMCLTCEVTKKTKEEMTQPVKEGACIHGLFMEGARWDVVTNSIANSRLKELYPMMPVIWIKAVTQVTSSQFPAGYFRHILYFRTNKRRGTFMNVLFTRLAREVKI